MTDSETYERQQANFWQALLLFVGAAAGAILVGYALAQDAVLDIQNKAFGFLSMGIAGGLIVAIQRWRGMIAALIFVPVLTGVLGWMAGDLYLTVGLDSLLMLLGLVFVMEFMWGRIFVHLRLGKFIYPGMVLAAASLLATLALAVIYSGDLFGSLLVRNMAQGCLIGLGLGLGTELAELLFVPQRH